MSEIAKQVGQRIRQAREMKGLTQKELASALGVSEAAVYRYEQGQNFTLDTLCKIAKAVGVTVEELVKGY
ncbi:XRE family transcriptional regulator [Fibrisoma montanum]|uniref:XRE family transcriptional regulator n=2 Tax=Fibrisoma montanum TaxID=2305895 RepID=A0A418MEB2_9BACT|nr:XRE family transcriptional regulator [Fibrisoma montanum]